MAHVNGVRVDDTDAEYEWTEEDKALLNAPDVEPQVPINMAFVSCCAIQLEQNILKHEHYKWTISPTPPAATPTNVPSHRPFIHHPVDHDIDKPTLKVVIPSPDSWVPTDEFMQRHTPANARVSNTPKHKLSSGTRWCGGHSPFVHRT
jgi:hypothetical protein